MNDTPEHVRMLYRDMLIKQFYGNDFTPEELSRIRETL